MQRPNIESPTSPGISPGANWNSMAVFSQPNALPVSHSPATAKPERSIFDRLRDRRIGLAGGMAGLAAAGMFAAFGVARKADAGANAYDPNLQYQVITTPSSTNRKDDKSG